MIPSVRPFELLCRVLALRAPLTTADRSAIEMLPCSIRQFEPGSYLVREGDLPETCAVLVTGVAVRQKTTGGGDRQITGLHIPGEALDLQNLILNVADHNVQMLSRGMVALVPRPAIQSLIRSHPGIAQAMIANVLAEASISREWVLNLGRRDARTKIAHVLCEFAVRMEAQGLAGEDVELPVTQEQLADVVGLTAVHVNRTLKALEREGLLRRDKRSVRVVAWKHLQNAGDFGTRYLHLENQRTAWMTGGPPSGAKRARASLSEANGSLASD